MANDDRPEMAIHVHGQLSMDDSWVMEAHSDEFEKGGSIRNGESWIQKTEWSSKDLKCFDHRYPTSVTER